MQCKPPAEYVHSRSQNVRAEVVLCPRLSPVLMTMATLSGLVLVHAPCPLCQQQQQQ